jgi:hypothetical protein
MLTSIQAQAVIGDNERDSTTLDSRLDGTLQLAQTSICRLHLDEMDCVTSPWEAPSKAR